MRRRLLFGFGLVLLVLSVLVVAWQGSFNLSNFNPKNPGQKLVYCPTIILVFVLMVTLGFMLFRELVKLYFARQSNQEGSRIRTKLVMGALALSFAPVICLVLFSFYVLSHSLNFWFTNPVDQQVGLFVQMAATLQSEFQDEVDAQAALLASLSDTRLTLESGARIPGFLERFAKEHQAQSAEILRESGGVKLDSWSAGQPPDG